MRASSVLREARLRAGLTQRELAERTGTTQPAVSRWETGRVRPSLETLRTLIQACGLELRLVLTEPVEDTGALLESTLALSPEQRFEQLVRSVRFIRAGRAAMADARAGK